MENQNLLDNFPDLINEWFYEKNIDLLPENIHPGSHKKVWWQCVNNNQHIWFAEVRSRTKFQTGCPKCGLLKRAKQKSTPKKGFSLLDQFPELTKEWDKEKNLQITPHDIKSGTQKKIWWKCLISSKHSWTASVNARVRGNGCPYCSGRMVLPEDSLAVKNFKVASEWHPHKNGTLTPSDVAVSSNKKVWWLCSKGIDHEWEAKISNRTVLKQGCSICSNQKVVKSNSLGATHPTLSKEWDFKLNIISPNEVVAGSRKKFYWRCVNNSKHQSYKAAIVKRVNNQGCPICAKKNRIQTRITPKPKTSLGDLFPHLISEWHRNKNGKLTPFEVNPGSNRKVWWKCPEGDDHEWNSEIRSRIKGMGCPICRGLKVVPSNSLAFRYPHLVKEWHPEKNKDLKPSDVHFGSHTKVWWKCSKNLEHPDWKAMVKSRTQRNSGCDFCWPTPQSKEELIILFELKWIFQTIETDGSKIIIDGKKWLVDIWIKELGLIIEYDGSYWHKDKLEQDKIKTAQLISAGYKVLRLRQMPLSRINDTDILIPQRYNGKKICDEILIYIKNNMDLNELQLFQIHQYLSLKKLQNQNEFYAYILNYNKV
jgi:hypothetical protein